MYLRCVIAGSAFGLALGGLAIALRARRRFQLMVAPIDGLASTIGSVPVGIAAFAWAAAREQAGLVPVLLALSSLFAVRAYLQVRDLYRQDQHLAYWVAHAALGGVIHCSP